ncbi:activated RNA polymerase II transcriptional coactivator p15 [Leptopilina heterotoma]|uniref:activated RNA polymerase II transcriptional coactivator p15 n=1 Tax=Leptopilina heterotoma TaxID=63436 RepID=UPI001CA8A7FA|nr:activated RNA polymerase II transcriptional coactivator p15 [Leptopilina heterotoma]
MPKSKEFVESDDSSASGSSSETEKKGKKRPKKEVKQKETTKVGSSSKKPKTNEDQTWELDEKCLVTVREFKGKTLVDIRHMYEDRESGELKPTKKGISLNKKLWQKLVDIIQEVDDVVKEK